MPRKPCVSQYPRVRNILSCASNVKAVRKHILTTFESIKVFSTAQLDYIARSCFSMIRKYHGIPEIGSRVYPQIHINPIFGAKNRDFRSRLQYIMNQSIETSNRSLNNTLQQIWLRYLEKLCRCLEALCQRRKDEASPALKEPGSSDQLGEKPLWHSYPWDPKGVIFLCILWFYILGGDILWIGGLKHVY